MHPRLFTSLVLIEPVIVPDTFSGLGPKLSLLSLKRQDTWPSRSAAIKSAQKSHRRWDPRVFERWIQHGYRELPTSTYPQIKGDTGLDTDLETVPVTLATSKYLEVMEYVRPNFEGHKPSGKEEHTLGPARNLLTHPDVIGPVHKTSPFYKSEAVIAWKLLDHIRPSVLYVIGDWSPIQTDIIRAELVCRTGVGVGGSGGAKSSQVKEAVISRSGHQVPLEKVKETSWAIARWIGSVSEKWRHDEERVAAGWQDQSAKDRLTMSAGWVPILEELYRTQERDSKM